MQCNQCQHENPSDAKFCNQCAAPFAPVCSACGHENTADAKFCNQCGAALMMPTSVPGSGQSLPQKAESESQFQVLFRAVMGLLWSEKRLTYRELKHVFGLDDHVLTEVCEELRLKRVAMDEEGKVLVWTGEAKPAAYAAVSIPNPPMTPEITAVTSSTEPLPPPPVIETSKPSNRPIAPKETISTEAEQDELAITPEPVRSAPEAERRQLTVMFCDLVGSTDLSGKLDPEDLREVVRAYQEAAVEVIQRYEGHIAQYLGDGLLIYFGFPIAHEDDAQRALYTGLGIPEAMANLNTRLKTEYGVELAVRIGIHTGPVVVGEMGGGGRHENLALGETPNIAARLEGLAQANTAVISPVTAQLVRRSFVLEELGPHELKGVAEPMMLYTVVGPRESDHDDHEDMLSGGFDALVGRDEEVGLLLRRWEQSKEGQGQVVLISGEAGLGKSSLVEGLRAHVRQEGYTRIAFRCSPYTENSALHPVIEHVQQVLDWQREDSIETRLVKLEQRLSGYQFPSEESIPLLASLLSLPLPEDRYTNLKLTPQQQRQQINDTLVAWMLEEAERQPLLAVWEDLHWADPSTLELLGLLIDEVPTVSMMNVLAYRPVFTPPWPTGSHFTPLVLNRLERSHIEVLARRLAGDKDLPSEVMQHVVSKTDGVPLYVEELTKMLLESELLREEPRQYVLTGSLSEATIPATLQDSLMARLDRLPTVKEVAQLGAVLGREFAYEMLHALSVVEEPALQEGLGQLVETELLYQRGRIPRAKYIFRHALIRDAAYQSLLRRTRQQVHQQVAQLLETRFPEVIEAQPEVVAHHYTEAACPDQAVVYWQQAGTLASQKSANQEAIAHLRSGLKLLAHLPETPERTQRELEMQTTLGSAFMVTQGFGSPEVGAAYTRARELCRQLGETPVLSPVLWGLYRWHRGRGEFQSARKLAAELLTLAQQEDDPALLLTAYAALGPVLFFLGEFGPAREHLEEGIAQHHRQRHRAHDFRYGQDPRVQCLYLTAWTLWHLGYPDQALQRSHEALSLAQELAHPGSQAAAMNGVLHLLQHRRDVQAVYDQAEALIAFTSEQPSAFYLAHGRFLRGWALSEQGKPEEGLEQMQQGLDALRATGGDIALPFCLPHLAGAYGKIGEAEHGLSVVAETLAITDKNGQRYADAEFHRLEGELRLQQSVADESQAESSFQQALSIAQDQQAKSLELRAAMSLARLWQSQGKRQDAYDVLAPVYEWFTEGFDTADLKDAKQLLDELKG